MEVIENLTSNASKTDNKAGKEETESRGLSVGDEFMLAEYKNISTAHFELHNAFRQMFRFYLGIVAVPITVFAFTYKDTSLALRTLPLVFVYILLLTGIIGLLMFLSLVNIRFDIVFYTRTVNGTRNYFMSRATETKLEAYLFLPGDMRYPAYNETYKAYWWQFLMIAIINSMYVTIVSLRLSGHWYVAIAVGALVFLVHTLAYYRLASRRDQKDQKRLEAIELKTLSDKKQLEATELDTSGERS